MEGTTETTVTTGSYEGPAGVVLTREEWLIVWSDLTRIPTAENGEIRRRIKGYLENE